MNTSSEQPSALLDLAPYQLNIYLGLALLLTGNLGCVGNMFVFHSRRFRRRAYSIYLFAAAIADFHYFNFVLVTRILQKGFRVSLTNEYLALCKLRQFSSLWGNVVSFSLFSFAVVDRLLSTNRSIAYRQWSNRISLAYKMVFVIPFVWFLVCVHRIILYRISEKVCGPMDHPYEYFDNYFEVLTCALAPVVVMSVLAYLLIRNVRTVVRRRIVPANHDILSTVLRVHPRLTQIDRKLSVMLITESLIAIVTYVPYAIELTYTNVSQSWDKTATRLAWEKVFVELIHLVSYVFFATSFYVSIATNMGFRRQLKEMIIGKRRAHLIEPSLNVGRT